MHNLPHNPALGLVPVGGASHEEPLPAILYVAERADTEPERMLNALRAEVIRCASGREALEIARTRPLACVVASLLLTDMSATALIPALKRVAPGLAVIVILDRPEVSEAVGVMQAGAWAVVDSQVLSTGLFHHVAPLLEVEAHENGRR